MQYAFLGLFVLFPLLMGGCPEYRNDVVSVVENATHDALLTAEDPRSIAEAATVAFVDATLTLFFDQFRTDEF